MKRRTTLAILLCLSAFLSCDRTSPDREPGIMPGDVLPEFSVRTSARRTVDNAMLSEGQAVICLFHTLCGDCRRELPEIDMVHLLRPDVTVLAISRNEDEASVSAYWKANGFTMEYSAQEDDSVFKKFAPHTVPRVYVVSDGRITAAYTEKPVSAEELISALK